jgi:hypothetical protein
VKTAAAHKLKLLRWAFKAEHVAYVTIDGMAGEHAVKAMRNHQHSIDFTLDRGRGFLVVDPDHIRAVRFHQIPEKPAPEDESQFESHIDD